MANELRGVTTTGKTVYALIVNNQGKFWNGSAFETYVSANYTTYDVAMTEQGSSGIYLGDFPAGILTSGTYEYFVKRQLNTGTYSESDPVINSGRIDWSGSGVIDASSGSMTGSNWLAYVKRQGFKRTDKDTEVYEATTDAVQLLRRRFGFSEAQAEAILTDSISILGDYKLNIESDHGLVVGVTMEDGTNAHDLIQIPKWQFNLLYPDINVSADRGYPKHFTIYNNAIEIGPAPDRVSYVYRVAYSKRGGTISSSSLVPFTAEYRDVLLDLTNHRLYAMLDEFEKSQWFQEQFENKFIDARRRENANQGNNTFMVRPMTL